MLGFLCDKTEIINCLSFQDERRKTPVSVLKHFVLYTHRTGDMDLIRRHVAQTHCVQKAPECQTTINGNCRGEQK
jgi:hypothetical protein